MTTLTFLFEMSDELEAEIFINDGKTYPDSLYEYKIEIENITQDQKRTLARFGQIAPEVNDLHELINRSEPITLLYFYYNNCADDTYHVITNTEPLVFQEIPDDSQVFDALSTMSDLYENEVDDCSEVDD